MLPLSYYQNSDTLFLAKDLIGKYLITSFNGIITGGMIVETEAYLGANDRACHAYNMRKTKRNEAMYSAGGIAYIYLCYGMHSLFNIVTHKENEPHAILIRAIIPEIGLTHMVKRRKKKLITTLTCGPGSLTQALGISTLQNKLSLIGNTIWLEDRGCKVNDILTTPRIGIDYAGEDVSKPWRFVLKT